MATVDSPRNRPSSPAPLTIASARTTSVATVRIGEDEFIAEHTVDTWVRTGVVARKGALLITREGQHFMLRDAVRVLGRRNGDTDPYGFTGRVDAIREFIRKGANVSADALRLGPAVYDVEFGFVAIAG